MRRYSPHLLSFLVGFISLSQEIIWVRIFSFANHTLPQAFGTVVVCFLVGIAFGAELGKRFCSNPVNLWRTSGAVMAASSLVDAACFFLITQPALIDPRVALLVVPVFIILTAGFKAVLFPIAHQLGTIAELGKVGRSLSRVYVCNILGSTLGPLVTGLFLLAFLTTQQCVFVMIGLSGLTSYYCFTLARSGDGGATALDRNRELGPRLGQGLSLLLVVLTIVGSVLVKDRLYFKLADVRDGMVPTKIIETKNGLVSLYGSVSGKEGSDDIVYGGNVYDGRTNLSLHGNSNLIDRVAILAALQPHPPRVLVIGLSIGTWLTIVDTFPGVEDIDVVEINEGYLQAIAYYPEQRRTLDDPRVHLAIDDGSRWLKAHPDRRYDLVVMNNTYHWRNFASNLLSREFLTEVSGHMNPGAIIAFNSTDSPDVLKTASVVFKFARRRRNFVMAADHDFTADLSSKESFDRMRALKLEGKSLLAASDGSLLKAYLGWSLVDVDQEEKLAGRPLEVITQDNMITEFKFGTPLFSPVWGHMFRKLGDRIGGIGIPHGPLEVTLKLPTKHIGGYEPLVSVPNREGGGAVVIINYPDPKHVILGYFHTGVIHKFTAPIEADYGKTHTLRVALGTILPPPDSRADYPGWSRQSIDAARQQVLFFWDGRQVFRCSADAGDPDNWYRPVVGANDIVSDASERRFTGLVLSQKRYPIAESVQ